MPNALNPGIFRPMNWCENLMRESEFEFIRKLVYERSRICLDGGKREMVTARNTKLHGRAEGRERRTDGRFGLGRGERRQARDVSLAPQRLRSRLA